MTKFYGKLICAEEIRPNLYTVFRKTFFTHKESCFLVRISADDYYKLKINGKLVGMGPAPAYTFNYNYNEFDITDYIIEGENQIEVTVYYQGLCNRVWVSGDNKQGLIADVYKDNKLFLCTDSSWTYTIDKTFVGNDTVGYDTAFLEHRNMTLVDTSEYIPMEIECNYTFAEKPFPVVRFYGIEPIKQGDIFDFKQEYVGTINLKLNSKNDNEKIIVLYGEELNDDGSVRYNLRCNCNYREEIILKKGENIIEQFDYKAFRYVQVILNENVILEDINMTVRHYPFDDNHFILKSDDEKLQKVFALCKNTIKYGCQETLVDCPTREKGQYIGDVMISGFSHLILTGDTGLLKKAIENIADSLQFSGDILAVSPCSFKQKIADYALQVPLILWRYYEYTKDTVFLSKMVPLCDKINEHYGKYADESGLLNCVNGEWNLVDWPESARDDYDFPLTDPIGNGKHNVINAFYLGSILYTEKIKTELKIPFEEKSTRLKKSFNKVFLKNGVYVDSEITTHSSLHANCLPVFFDICPEEHKISVGKLLIEKEMACSVYMSFFYLKALCKLGYRDTAYKLITSDSKNSWLNMINEGATTTFEAWGKTDKWNTSLFHPWATAPIITIAEELL